MYVLSLIIKHWHKFDWGLAFIVSSLSCCVYAGYAEVAFLRDRFSFFAALEILLFGFLLLCMLTVFGKTNQLQKYSRVADFSVDVKKVFAYNILSIFFAYLLVLVACLVGFTKPFSVPLIFGVFAKMVVTLHSQDYALIGMKIAYLVIVLLGLLLQCNYLYKGKISFQHYCLMVLLAWNGLFVIGVSALFVALLLLDAASLLIASLVGLSAVPGANRPVSFALHYYILSALTSVLAYAGCIMIYSVFRSLNIDTIVLMATLSSREAPFVTSPAVTIGVFFIIFKVMFLLGIFPFQHYVVEVSRGANYGFLMFFLVITKFPVLVFFLLLLKIMWLNFYEYRAFLMLAALTTIIYSAMHIMSTARIKQFLAYGSINQYGFIFAMFYFPDVYAAFVGFMLYFVYVLALVPFLAFLAAAQNYDRARGEIETWYDLARCVNDSFDHYKIAMTEIRPGPAMYFYGGSLTCFVALITIGGFPPLAGFIAKLYFIEVFLNYKVYYVLAGILVTTLFTMFAYANAAMAFLYEFNRVDANDFLYQRRLIELDDIGGVLQAFSLILLAAAALAISDLNFVWTVFDHTIPILWDVHDFKEEVVRRDAYQLLGRGVPITEDQLAYIIFMSQIIVEKLLETMRGLKNRFFSREFVGDFEKRIKNRLTRFCEREFTGDNFYVEYAVALFILGVLALLPSGFEKPYYTAGLMWCITFFVGMAWFAAYIVGYKFFGSRYLYRRIAYSTAALSFIFPAIPATFLWCLGVIVDWICKQNFFLYRAQMTLINDIVGFWLDKVYYIMWGMPVLFVFIVSIISAWESYELTFGRISWANTWEANADCVRVWISYTVDALLMKWAHRTHLYWFYAYWILYVWSPINRIVDWHINHARLPLPQRMRGEGHDYFVLNFDLWFFATAVQKTFAFFTCDFILLWVVFWAAAAHLFYARFLSGELRPHAFVGHIDELFSKRHVMGSAEGAIGAGFYFFLAVLVPIGLAFEFPMRGAIGSLYLMFLPELQIAIGASWSLFIIIIVFNGFTRKEAGLIPFLRSFYYFSVSITIYLLNYCIAYNAASLNSKLDNFFWVDGELLCKLDPYYFFPLLDNIPLLAKECFTFGFDYLAIIMCTMTAFVFSLVFLTSIYNPNIGNKKLFFVAMFCVEILVLGAFLCTNLMGFFILFETSLLPMTIIIAAWGSSPKRWFAARSFLFYSLGCSLPMMFAVVYMYRVFATLDNAYIINNLSVLTAFEKKCIWVAFFLMFAVKVPMFPLHSWLLHAHVEAPTGGSVVLAAVLLKMGLYGFIRYSFGFFHDLSISAAKYVIALAIIGIVFSAVSAITELDAKKVVAQTSIAHMNLAVIGIFIGDPRGMLGAVYVAIGHAVVSAGLFFLIGALYDRFHTRNLLCLGGLAQLMPLYAVALFFLVFANAGFPWSLSFVGELFILVGAVKQISLLVFGVIIFSSVVLLYANLRLFMYICFGTLSSFTTSNATTDLTHFELFCCAVFISNAFIMMINSDVYFWMLKYDHVIRYVF